MTASAPIQAPPASPVSVGRLARLKLTEPVRLYCYPLLVLLVVGGVAGGLVTQDWADWALPILGGLLSAGPVEAARASVYSPRSVVQAVRRAASQ